MSEFATKLKSVMQRSASFIGKNAEAVANTTKYKMNEMSALSKRRELIASLGEKVYALIEEGASIPEELNDLLVHIKALDANLDALRADHSAQKAAAAEKAAVEKAERAAQKAQAAMAKCSTPVEEIEMEDAIVEDDSDAVLDYSCDAATEDADSEGDSSAINT